MFFQPKPRGASPQTTRGFSPNHEGLLPKPRGASPQTTRSLVAYIWNCPRDAWMGRGHACGYAARRLQEEVDAVQPHEAEHAPNEHHEERAVSAPLPDSGWPTPRRDRACREGMIAEWLEVR